MKSRRGEEGKKEETTLRRGWVSEGEKARRNVVRQKVEGKRDGRRSY